MVRDKTKRDQPIVVSLDDIVAHMDLPNDDWTAYLNRRTGELVTVTDRDQELAEAEETPEDLPKWQAEALPKVSEALESDDFLELPGKLEIDEYRMMEYFSFEVEDARVRNELLQAIRGRGAFRRFKEIIHERGIADAWYAYRQHALEEIAVDWLEANGIAFGRRKPQKSDDAT